MVEGSQVTPKKSSLDDPRSEFPADTICQDKVCIAKNNGNFVPRKKKKKQEEKGLILAGGLLTMLILWLRQTNQLKLTMLDAIMKSIQSAQFRLPIVRKQKVAVTILSSDATTSAGGYL
ncbi:uncharacterized protein LOC108463073 isoform X12 [Gossypium arboreum]|uniref:uncharacterized protein LOC108463073 isoform X12 n=1 Tax=Gossypium arboreum TaxID=29729 RepID=UPI0022F14850|nr:uncharacterized protein LOC108463073 isoform X12 [Gossypium arboreum]